MSCLVQQSGGVELLFYGELNGAERLELQHHLTRCAECRLALEELQLIKAALGTRPTVCAPPGGDWTGFMARLSKAVAAEPRHAGAGAVIGPGLQPSSGRSIGGYAGYIAMAALLVLVTLSVAYLAQSRNAVHETQAALTPTTAAGGGDGQEHAAEDHRPRYRLADLERIEDGAQIMIDRIRPQNLELRERKIGHALLNATTERRWTRYFCRMISKT